MVQVVTLRVPVEDGYSPPETWDWTDLCGTADPVVVVSASQVTEVAEDDGTAT